MDGELEKIPSIGISYTAELPGKKALVLQSFIERDADPKVIDALLDKIRVAGERQEAFGIVEILKRTLEQEEKLANDHAARMAQVDENIKKNWQKGSRKGDVQLSVRELQEQQQAYNHAEESKRRIAKVKADLAAEQAKIGA